MKDDGGEAAAVVVVESAERCLGVLCGRLEAPQDACVAFWGVGNIVLACSDGAKLGVVGEAMPAGVSVLGTTLPPTSPQQQQQQLVFRVAQEDGRWLVAGVQDKDGHDAVVLRTASVPWERLVVAFVPCGCVLDDACDSSTMLVRVGKSALVPVARQEGNGDEWTPSAAGEAASTPVGEMAEHPGGVEHVRAVAVELMPLLTRVTNVPRTRGASLRAEQGVVCLVDRGAAAASVACTVANHAARRTRLARQLAEMPGLSARPPRAVLRTVQLAQLAVALEVVEPAGALTAAAQTALVRAQAVLQRSLGLCADCPLLHALYQPPFVLQHLEQPCAPVVAPQHLVDVHLAVPPPAVAPAEQGALCVRVVRGSAAYFHYGQDGVDDSGWGCAYRSLQTLCSWLVLRGATAQPIPTHRAAQQLLVDAGDKPRRLVGSREWIGAVEVALCLQRLCGVECRVLHVASGRDVAAHAQELARHFEAEGTPVMVGGGTMAYTLLGVAWHPQSTAAARFLVLDPHYTGPDTPAAVVARGGCAWRPPTMFRPDTFYNFCLPLCPRVP